MPWWGWMLLGMLMLVGLIGFAWVIWYVRQLQDWDR